MTIQKTEERVTKDIQDNDFDFRYEPVDNIEPLEMVGNALLSLHHHMAPSDSEFDLELNDD